MKKIVTLMICFAIILSACDKFTTVETHTPATTSKSIPAVTAEPTIVIAVATSTPTPIPTPEPMLESFDESYDNGDRSFINVAVYDDEVFYITENHLEHDNKGLLYSVNVKTEKRKKQKPIPI